jgi:MFS family permease
MSALVLLGGSIGALLAGFTSHSFGKRKSMMMTDVIMILGSILCNYPNTITFGIGRFICGLASGCFSMLCSSYIIEFSPSHLSASMGSLNQISMMLGIITSNSICMTLPLNSCDSKIKFQAFSIFSVPGVACFIQLVLFLSKFKKESPVWLVKRKEYEKAAQSAEEIYEENYIQTEIERIKQQYDDNSNEYSIQNSEATCKDILTCSKTIRKAMRLGIFIHMFQQLSGINAVMFYSTLLFENFGGSLLISRVLTIVGTGVRILALLVVFPFINRVSKKKLSIYGSLMMMGCFFVLVFTLEYSSLTVMNAVIVFLFLAVFTTTAGQVPWFYSSLIMPDKGISLAAPSNFLIGTVVVLSFPFLLEELGLKVTFGIYTFFNFCSAVYSCVDMVDCAQVSSYEIRRFLSTMK